MRQVSLGATVQPAVRVELKVRGCHLPIMHLNLMRTWSHIPADGINVISVPVCSVGLSPSTEEPGCLTAGQSHDAVLQPPHHVT